MAMTPEEITLGLEQVGRLGEALLLDVRWLNFGFQVDLVFNAVTDRYNRVRDDLDGEPWLTTLSAVAVERFEFVGALNPTQKQMSPSDVPWGLSEVALVRVRSHDVSGDDGIRIEVVWDMGLEQRRRITIDAMAAAIELPPQCKSPRPPRRAKQPRHGGAGRLP